MGRFDCFDYTRFAFSGVNLGLYALDINPDKYIPYPQRNTQEYHVIAGSDPTVNQDYNKILVSMSWGFMPEEMWNDLLPYTRKNYAGQSDTIYFWDNPIGRFSGIQVKITKFEGKTIAGNRPIDRYDISLELREV